MSTKQRTENEEYKEKKEIFASLTKEAEALGLKDIYEHFNEGSEQEVIGILPKKYKTEGTRPFGRSDTVVEVSLHEVDIDEAIEEREAPLND